jgi:hypothetical protein
MAKLVQLDVLIIGMKGLGVETGKLAFGAARGMRTPGDRRPIVKGHDLIPASHPLAEPHLTLFHLHRPQPRTSSSPGRAP